MRLVAIVQARMGSTRLPGKTLIDLCGRPMLARVVERLRRASLVQEVMVATSTLAADDAIVELCAAQGWRCFRGSATDVLDRYVQAARAADAEAVMRITGDCPLIDPEIVDQVAGAFLERQPELDYACNFFPRRTFPRGLDTEILRRDTLDYGGAEATDPASREHVTTFIYQNPDRFRIHGILAADGEWSDRRWTVDAPEDLALVSAVYNHFGHDRFGWREVLAAFDEHPEWNDLNRHIEQKTF